MTLFIFVLLVVINPLLELSVMVVLGGTYVFIYKIVQQKKLYDIGQRRFQVAAELLRINYILNPLIK